MLKIRGKKKEIIKAMQDVAKATPGKTTLEILNNLLLEAKDRELHIKGTNLDTSIEIALEVQVEEEGSVLVDTKNTIEFISKVYSDEISLYQSSKNTLTIGYDLSEAKLRASDAEQYPRLPTVDRKDSLVMKAIDFKEMAEKVTVAAATDSTRPILTGVLFDITEGHFTMVALDGFRLIKAKKVVEGIKQNKKIVVPGKALQNIAKLIGPDKDAEVEIIASDSHAEIGYYNIRYVTRLLEGEFVDYDKIIPQTTGMSTKVKINAGQVKKVAERVSLLAEQGDKRILDLELTKDKLQFSGESVYGSANEEITVSDAAGEISISVDTKYLLDSLDAFVGECTMYMTTASSPIIVEDTTGDTTALLLPVRKKPATTKAA